MRCIDDRENGIILNHDGAWSDRVRIAWYVASERRDPGPTPPSLRECWCDGPDLVAGRFTPISGPPNDDEHRNDEPPVNVLTRAVALAVEGYLRHRLECFVDDLFIRRGEL